MNLEHLDGVRRHGEVVCTARHQWQIAITLDFWVFKVIAVRR